MFKVLYETLNILYLEVIKISVPLQTVYIIYIYIWLFYTNGIGCEARSVFSLAPCPVASCRLNLLINSTCCKVSQMLVHRSITQQSLFQCIGNTDILKQGLLLHTHNSIILMPYLTRH